MARLNNLPAGSPQFLLAQLGKSKTSRPSTLCFIYSPAPAEIELLGITVKNRMELFRLCAKFPPENDRIEPMVVLHRSYCIPCCVKRSAVAREITWVGACLWVSAILLCKLSIGPKFFPDKWSRRTYPLFREDSSVGKSLDQKRWGCGVYVRRVNLLEIQLFHQNRNKSNGLV